VLIEVTHHGRKLSVFLDVTVAGIRFEWEFNLLYLIQKVSPEAG
jgi:hypothetical protein